MLLRASVRRAAATRRSTDIPRSAMISAPLPDAPKSSMPTTSPSSPTQRHQASLRPA